MSEAHLTIFSGVPGSGKSTEALRFLGELRSRGQRAVRLNRDDTRTHLFGESYHLSPPVSFCEVQVSKVLEKLLAHYLEEGWHVLSDDTNLNVRDVNRMARTAKSMGAEVDFIPVLAGLELSLQRNRLRAEAGGRFVPEEIIRSMWEKQFEGLKHNNFEVAPTRYFIGDSYRDSL